VSDGPQFVIFGCLTTDNVVTATGDALPQVFGGSCLYAALGARVWSDRVGVVSRYGTGYSEAPIDLLRGLGVDTSGIRKLAVPHGRNVAFAYRADGSRTRAIPPALIERIPFEERARFLDTSLLPEAGERWRQFAPDGDDAPPEWWHGAVGVHSAYMPVTKHRHIAETARRTRGKAISIQVDSWWHDPSDPEVEPLGPLFRRIDALLPSEADVEAFHPGAPLAQTAHALLDAGAGTVVLKLGASGCQVFTRTGGLIAEIPVVDVVARDPTGAGDAFCGGFLAGMHVSNDVVTAARYGAVSASFAVEAPGLTGLAERSRKAAGDRLRSITPPSRPARS
jgi:sugar/nucleoside kinase (ribokinase family)